MKNLFLIVFLFAGATVFAQDGVNFSGNTMTTKETPPVWPGCEQSEKSKKACFQEKLVQHLKENYKFPKDADGKIIRGKSVVSFIINKEGQPEITKVEGPRKELNDEAKRIILSIPKMQPGELAGKPVAVSYKVPFTF
ncbi:energy transducer TonB [Salinimicrobium xinjiangense]|uniref:energy transducer TonB n=1 Tax=Salinimicrobium xinjiangense TaxID=438596 RepID=UPI00041FE473|nr:energy transducer TonB [Salinimicrobium xinjiangense]